jgi:predicted O-methyltransferase YrrM
MLPVLKKLIPKSLKRKFRRFQGKGLTHSAYLQESTSYADIGEAGPLVKDIFSKIKDVPGWFNVDDCGHFFLTLSYQSAMGLKGDMLEIGSYHGRSTALMAKCLQPDERLVVCDAFESDTHDSYANKPSPENLISNIERLSPLINRELIVIHKGLSNDLCLDSGEMFRFIHIDGGHSAEQAYFDLNLCSKHTISSGIIVMDDYHNKRWPGVTEGTDRFLSENHDFVVLADLNRHGALGRKIYLIRRN